ncbi:hypothetical protein ACFLU6_15970, partial [Acidobacteriota bacterium]
AKETPRIRELEEEIARLVSRCDDLAVLRESIGSEAEKHQQDSERLKSIMNEQATSIEALGAQISEQEDHFSDLLQEKESRETALKELDIHERDRRQRLEQKIAETEAEGERIMEKADKTFREAARIQEKMGSLKEAFESEREAKTRFESQCNLSISAARQALMEEANTRIDQMKKVAEAFDKIRTEAEDAASKLGRQEASLWSRSLELERKTKALNALLPSLERTLEQEKSRRRASEAEADKIQRERSLEDLNRQIDTIRSAETLDATRTQLEVVRFENRTLKKKLIDQEGRLKELAEQIKRLNNRFGKIWSAVGVGSTDRRTAIDPHPDLKST